ncbi:unnamed protein product [Fraxinus pennsylvanica]|uniref:Uncharacterized protein n=1 Tax=Fraxinus pennsylvanica TaxID=56036 RepID=A0AAD2EA54_9LAMI|nr:unnamed protein product [Fraxinus pennsylvanica]
MFTVHLSSLQFTLYWTIDFSSTFRPSPLLPFPLFLYDEDKDDDEEGSVAAANTRSLLFPQNHFFISNPQRPQSHSTKRALANTIGRTASRVVPLAIWASSGSRRYHHHYSALFDAVKTRGNLSRKLFPRSFSASIHHYSPKRPSSDKSLLRVIESEIQCAQESEDNDEVVEVHQGFPFKIEDHPGWQTITVTRESQGETISVEVHMPDLVTGEENDDGNDPQLSIPLVVRVSKRNGPCLKFGCTLTLMRLQLTACLLRTLRALKTK